MENIKWLEFRGHREILIAWLSDWPRSDPSIPKAIQETSDIIQPRHDGKVRLKDWRKDFRLAQKFLLRVVAHPVKPFTTFCDPSQISRTRFLLRVVVCNIIGFFKFSEISEKLKTFWKLYVCRFENKIHAYIHHFLALFAFEITMVEILFPLENLFEKILKTKERLCCLSYFYFNVLIAYIGNNYFYMFTIVIPNFI